MDRIVVGVDGSAGARAALEWALDEARLRKAELEVVHAWHFPYVAAYPYAAAVQVAPETYDDEAHRFVEDLLASVDTSGVTVVHTARMGTAAHVLLESAKGADLLVVGSRGVGGFSGLLLGSVSQQVVHHASCPVVVIPDADR